MGKKSLELKCESCGSAEISTARQFSYKTLKAQTRLIIWCCAKGRYVSTERIITECTRYKPAIGAVIKRGEKLQMQIGLEEYGEK